MAISPRPAPRPGLRTESKPGQKYGVLQLCKGNRGATPTAPQRGCVDARPASACMEASTPMAKADGTVSGIGLAPLAVLLMARGAPPRAWALARAKSTARFSCRATTAGRANFRWTGKFQDGACWSPPRPPASPHIMHRPAREWSCVRVTARVPLWVRVRSVLTPFLPRTHTQYRLHSGGLCRREDGAEPARARCHVPAIACAEGSLARGVSGQRACLHLATLPRCTRAVFGPGRMTITRVFQVGGKTRRWRCTGPCTPLTIPSYHILAVWKFA